MIVSGGSSRWSMAARCTALAVLFHALLGPSLARASEERHVVPDIRGETTHGPRAQTRLLRLPLTIHVATGGERVAFDVRRLGRAIARANEALRPYGLEVYIARVVLLPDGYAAVRHRRDRRKLAHYAPPDGTVHVFLVGRLELGGALRPDRTVRGLHWRYRGLLGRLKNREYVIVGNDAPATTLVHELGHLFGLEHDTSHQNLMCSCRQGPRQIFTFGQGSRMHAGALAFLARQR